MNSGCRLRNPVPLADRVLEALRHERRWYMATDLTNRYMPLESVARVQGILDELVQSGDVERVWVNEPGTFARWDYRLRG